MKTNQKTKIFASILFIFLLCSIISVSSTDQEEVIRTYSPSSETICKEDKCNTVFYSGIKYIYEDNTWKDRKEAKSFKDSGIECVVNFDGTNIANCIDYNETSRTIEFSTNQDLESVSPSIPLRKYSLEFNEDTKELERIYTTQFETNLEFDKVNDKQILLIKSNPSEIIEFGEHSTEVILQDADVENLEDVHYTSDPELIDNNYYNFIYPVVGAQPTGYYINITYKFNISSIPSGTTIENATLNLYTPECLTSCADVGAKMVDNQAWWEGSGATDGSQVCGSNPISGLETTEQDILASSEYTINSWVYFEVTNGVDYYYNLNYDNISIQLGRADNNNSAGPRTRFYAKEYSVDTSKRPYLNITYSTNQAPAINLQAPINETTLTPGSIEFIYNVSDSDGDDVDNCSLYIDTSLDQTDDSITQIINQSFLKSLSTGNYTWQVKCSDNVSNLGLSEIRALEIYGINNVPTIDVPSIIPDPAYTDSELNCSVTAYDIDLDSITIEFKWYNGSVYTAYENVSTSNGTLASSVLTSGLQAKSEVWNCSVRAFDGKNVSSTEIDSITISNTAPTHSTPVLQSEIYYNASNEDLTCLNQNTNDLDNDAVTNVYSWYLNSASFAQLILPFESSADDYSGSSNDGVISGATFVSGQNGNALDFDGDDYVNVSADLDMNTVSLWFENSTGWFHVANISGTVYLNGVLGDSIIPVIKENGEVMIGKTDPSTYFTGKIDEVRIYNKALSSGEINNHYNLDYENLSSAETSVGNVWSCKVVPNDGVTDGSELESNSLTIQNNVYDITFNITEGEYGNGLTGVFFACDGFSDTTSSSPQTYKFYEGNYNCEFEKLGESSYFNKTESFTADSNKQLNIEMSVQAYLTIQEHDWLEENNDLLQAVYDCLYEGNCYTLNLTLNYLEEINDTTQDLWREFQKPDETVVLDETVTNNVLSSTQNITIDYSIRVPPKAGYSDGDFLPIRIFYWFLDPANNETCMNQNIINAKYETDDIAEDPYCIPLVATTLGRINEITNFTVSLKPNLEDGNYEVVSSVEIDPNQIWIKYSQKLLGMIDVLESNDKASISLFKQEAEENFEDLSTDLKSSGLTLVSNQEKASKVENAPANVEIQSGSGSQLITIMGMILGFLTVVVICFTILKIKLN